MKPAVVALVALAILPGCLSEGGPEGPRSSPDGCPLDPALVEMDLSVSNLAGGGRLGPTASRAYPVPLGMAGTVPWTCVRSLSATIRWTNGVDSGADLYVGLDSPPAGLSAVGNDGQQLFIDGTHEETVAAPVTIAQAPLLAQGLDLVVYSDWMSLSNGGVAVHATVAIGYA